MQGSADDAIHHSEMGLMRGIIMCMSCRHHQPWISRWICEGISSSICMKCGRRNRFWPHRFNARGELLETRGRKHSVIFRRRPEHTIHLQLLEESRHRNAGSFVNVEDDQFRTGDLSEDRAARRIYEMLKKEFE